MIIKGLMLLVKNLLSLLLVFNLPSMPDSIHTIMLEVTSYLGSGISIIRAFIGAEAMSVMATLLTVVLIVNAAYFLYTAVMWILRKIPALGISN